MKTLFTGDISPTAYTAPLFQRKDIKALFADAATLFEGNDFTFVNLECALTESEHAITKFGPNLKGPIETAAVLKALHVDVCGLSNNHVFDFGIPGIQDTLRALAAQGIAYTGFGENYEDSRKNFVFERQGETLCVIAVCEHEYSYALEDRMGSRPYDPYDTMEDIRAAKQENDRVVVLYHGGKEHCPYPSPRLRKLCHAMAKNGADVVLCQHSHCIGTYEQIEGCHILYGQGNFQFAKPYDFATWYSGLAVAYDTVSGAIDFIPVVMTDTGIRLAVGQEKDDILSAFEARSKTLESGEWKKEWHRFCESMRDVYEKVIGDACTGASSETDNAKFAHYLDCEAHTDVWRECFPTYNLTNEK